MKQALERKDTELAGAQKVAREKTKATEKKLASVGKLEKENEALKAPVKEVKKEAAQLKEEKVVLTDKVHQLTRKRDDLEAYMGSLAKKLYIMLEGNLSHSVNSITLLTHLMLLLTNTYLFCTEFCRNIE